MNTIKEAMEAADEINCALLDAKNALDAIYAKEPETPTQRVQEGTKRHEKIAQILEELGGALARSRYGYVLAKGLVCDVRVIRGARAETVYEAKYLRAKTVYSNGQPDHVEIECNEVERKKDYGS